MLNYLLRTPDSESSISNSESSLLNTDFGISNFEYSLYFHFWLPPKLPHTSRTRPTLPPDYNNKKRVIILVSTCTKCFISSSFLTFTLISLLPSSHFSSTRHVIFFFWSPPSREVTKCISWRLDERQLMWLLKGRALNGDHETDLFWVQSPPEYEFICTEMPSSSSIFFFIFGSNTHFSLSLAHISLSNRV